jgi:hypothetical protein
MSIPFKYSNMECHFLTLSEIPTILTLLLFPETWDIKIWKQTITGLTIATYIFRRGKTLYYLKWAE